ncbi:hypothetical protein RHGRI_029288 [Rhododendron griersonianum]|uniref:Uncharacterized protein n=1 Tax=Rhododendron griersonianum TaxID=479676 RepID=A0AAV6ING0_9ERIC|nr:hypothetical protein RHGRI_029288 [Rhododendron griersonianum]
MSVSNGKLSAHFEAVEARFLRASLCSLCFQKYSTRFNSMGMMNVPCMLGCT